MGSRVVLAMSGGVDSSVAAHLLKEQGHEVIGLFMRTGAHGDDVERRSKTCCSATDAVDARGVADRLDIPFYALDFERDFARIMDEFADEYAAGRTPNPCVLCNIWLKFGKLWAYGQQAGADFVATGHYARMVVDGDGSPRVARAIDPTKDQSYVLFGLARELLPHVLLPVGGYSKAEIRAIARDLGLPVHDKPDSQEICFVPDDDYIGFIRSKRRPEPGYSRERSSTKTATFLGRPPRDRRRSRSASGAGWGSPRPVSPATSSRSSRRPTPSPSAAAPRSTGSAWRPRSSAGTSPSPPARPAAWRRSGPGTRRSRPPSSRSSTAGPASSSTSPRAPSRPARW